MRDAENSAGKRQACMHGFPAKPTKAKWKEPAGYFLFGGMEILIHDVRVGKEIAPEVVSDAFQLIQRADALKEALLHRVDIHYPESMVEDEA